MEAVIKIEGITGAYSKVPRGEYRLTETTAHNSAILGMIGAALGVRRGEPLGVDVQIESVELTYKDRFNDYQTIQNGASSDGTSLKHPKTSIRSYLTEPVLSVVISGDDVGKVCEAMERPVFQLYLGRRCCVPSKITTTPHGANPMTLFTYKGYIGSVTPDPEAGVFSGTVLGISDIITFEGDTPQDARREFHESIDYYLDSCAKLGHEPARMRHDFIIHKDDEIDPSEHTHQPPS